MSEVSTVECSKSRICYTMQEKNYIVHLVEKYKSVLECKGTDKCSTDAKNKIWEKIAAEFNAQPDVTPRKTPSIRKCWENLKRTTEKEVNEFKTFHLYLPF